jgi:hypothetical protein
MTDRGLPVDQEGAMMKNKHRASYAALALTVILGVIGIASGQVWAKKPYQEWSKSEVEKLLSDSPWAQQHIQHYSSGGNGGNSSNERRRAPDVDFTVTARLRSALPIRQALARQMQIEAKYDKMSETERAALDAKTKSVLDCPPCRETYAVALSSRSEQDRSVDPVYGSFRDSTLDQLKKYVYLENDRGERRAVVDFIRPQGLGADAIFVFARRDASGKPLVTAEDKKLTLRFGEATVSSLFTFEFDVHKMLLNGDVAF